MNKRKLINRDNIYQHLLEKEFNLIDMTIQNALLERNWKEKWTITKEQLQQLEDYAIPLLKKTFKFSTKKAVSTFAWFWLQHGIKVKD
jgi:hypothetical protein